MSKNHRTAELIGAHMALSTPLARACRRVAHGWLAFEEATALMVDSSERECLRRVFMPPTPHQRDRQLAALLARLAAETESSPWRPTRPAPW